MYVRPSAQGRIHLLPQRHPLYETLYEYRDNDAEMQRRLAYWLEGYWRANQAKIDTLGAWFFTAAVGLILQLVFWTWALAGTI
jgi:hypothetical protein